MNRRYNDKIEKYKNCDGILGTDQIIPIIIGYDGILYRQSAELLDKMYEEIAPATLYKAIYREIGYPQCRRFVVENVVSWVGKEVAAALRGEGIWTS